MESTARRISSPPLGHVIVGVLLSLVLLVGSTAMARADETGAGTGVAQDPGGAGDPDHDAPQPDPALPGGETGDDADADDATPPADPDADPTAAAAATAGTEVAPVADAPALSSGADAMFAPSALTQGITETLLVNGLPTYGGLPVVDEGDELTLRVQYNNTVAPGSTVVFELGTNVTVTGVPTTNTAIASVVQNGNTVEITFADPWPPEVNQGVFDLKFTVDDVDESAITPITWDVDGDQGSVTVIVRDSGDVFENVTNGSAKSRTNNPATFDNRVSVSGGVVTVNPLIVGQVLNYTLRLDSETARAGFAIDDQLPAGLAYIPGSFGAQLTTWDADGLNRQTDPVAFSPTVTGNSFAGSVDVPGPSSLAITYQAAVPDDAARLALQAQLQAAYDALGGAPGNFEIVLTNTATFGGPGGAAHSASIRMRGTIAGPVPGNGFSKTSDWSTRNVVTDDEGNLTPPADITYTLRANLSQWDGSDANFTLTRNVVISDVLPSQASWNTGDPAFISATGIALSALSPCPADQAAMASAPVGSYCVNGQLLLINVGQDPATNATIQVKAQLDTVAGLTVAGTTPIVDATPFRWRNDANYHYRDGAPYLARRDVTVVELPDDDGDGINDPSAFSKTGSTADTSIDPGDTVTMDYRFTVAAGLGVDVRQSRIVDYIDTAVFDLGDLSAVVIAGAYNGVSLTSEHFALSVDDDGNLVIQLSAAGDAIVTAHGLDRALVIDLSLTTTPFEGKVTKTITNRATLFGDGVDPDYWSETGTEATSYGDEAEVRKRVFGRDSDEWVETLPAQMDGEGNLVQDTYVYRVEFIPHGSYDSVVIIDVDDVLPAAVNFLGFVTEANAATAQNPIPGPVDIGGNLEAVYDAASGTVTLQQRDGTLLDAGGFIGAYFAVEVTDASAPIVNRIGTASATIVPLRSVSVGNYVWVDTDRDGRQDPDEPGIPGVVLELIGPDGGPVTDVFGNVVGPVTTGPNGEYTFENLPALTGEQIYRVRIDREASAAALAPYVPTVSGTGDRAGDSSAWEASTVPGELHEDGDRDPTLDFGFVLPLSEPPPTTTTTPPPPSPVADPPVAASPAAGGTPTGTLPTTGADLGGFVLVAAVSLLAGVVAAVVTRRRRDDAPVGVR